MTDIPTPDQIAALYEAATEEDGLARMAALLRQILEVDSAGVWLTEGSEIRDLTLTQDIVASAEPYLAYFNRIDPWTASKRMLNRVYLASEEYDERALLESEFYNDFARHYGMLRPMGIALDLGAGLVASVSTNRGSPHRLLGATDKARLMAFAVHLRGALKLRYRLALERSARQDVADSLQVLSFGAVVCTADGLVIHANRSAERLAAMGLRLGTRHPGLAAGSAAETSRLRALVEAAAVRGQPGGLLLTGPDGRRCALLVTPLPGSIPSREGGRALVALRDTGAPASPSAALLRQLFDLTPAQAALCVQLARGLTFEEAASERGIARSTARTHLLGVLDRTGTANLRDLLRLLGTLPQLETP